MQGSPDFELLLASILVERWNQQYGTMLKYELSTRIPKDMIVRLLCMTRTVVGGLLTINCFVTGDRFC